MGLCGSSDAVEAAKNKEIEKEQQNTMKKNEQYIKLLLLGAGESGKSTIFKQMKLLYGKFYQGDELRNLVPVVHNNILQNLIIILDYAYAKKIELTEKEAYRTFMDKYDEDSPVDETVANLVSKLWNDPVFQKLWSERSSIQVLECLSYYCNEENLTRISKPNYLPTEMDILQARVRTSGIVEEKYVIDGVNFVLFDVGGQRNERKKWIHCFDSVTAVLFVAAISEYDQMLYEDSKTKRMDEALKLFDEICNSPYFTSTSMLLFLNKKDLFETKLFKIPYRVPGVRNEDFEGPYAEDEGVDPNDAITAATKHTLNKFLALRKDPSKEIYHHITCATDTHNVKVVFSACKDIILRSNLVTSGFMHQ